MEFNEREIIDGCLNKDRTCQKRLYERFAPKMLGVCMRYSKDKAEAEDMLQEGFIKIFSDLTKYRAEGSLEGWIRRVVVFTAINFFKKRIRTFKETLDYNGVEVFIDEDIIEKLAAKDILALVQKLAPGYKTIFNMYAIDGYSHKEISEILGIAIGTSKSQYLRAKQQMQKMLAEQFQIYKKVTNERG